MTGTGQAQGRVQPATQTSCHQGDWQTRGSTQAPRFFLSWAGTDTWSHPKGEARDAPLCPSTLQLPTLGDRVPGAVSALHSLCGPGLWGRREARPSIEADLRNSAQPAWRLAPRLTPSAMMPGSESRRPCCRRPPVCCLHVPHRESCPCARGRGCSRAGVAPAAPRPPPPPLCLSPAGPWTGSWDNCTLWLSLNADHWAPAQAVAYVLEL